MTADTERLERELAADLKARRERLIDEKFCRELYRALADNEWSREGEDGAVALSWTIAERLINDLRREVDRPPLTLAQTGGEGEVSRTVEEELGRLGWRHRPLPTDRDDPHHVGESAASPPPADAALKKKPGAQTEEERFRPAHEAAHRAHTAREH